MFNWDWRRIPGAPPTFTMFGSEGSPPLLPVVPGGSSVVPSFITPVPSPPTPPAPPAPPAPAVPPTRPPSMTMFKGLPLGPQTRETVIQPPPSVQVPGRPPIPLVGPGPANPSVTGAPITPTAPGTEFGNPATREALRTLPATATPTKGGLDDIWERVKNGDFNGALTSMGKSFGGGGGGGSGAVGGGQAPEKAQLIPGHAPHKPQVAVPSIEKLIANSAGNLTLQELKQKAAKRRKAQDKYDIENWGQR